MFFKSRYLLIVSFIMIASVLVLKADDGRGPPVLRVKLGELGPRTTTVKGHALKWKGGPKYSLQGPVRIDFKQNRFYLNGHKRPLPFQVFGKESVSVDGDAFRGDLLVTDSGSPLLINLVDAESYVAGVINQEIDSAWPEAAVDAQSILARSYALKRSKERADRSYDLDRTVHDQVYGGIAAEDELSRASAERTRGRVLSYQGKTASGLYHSCCGGRTELPSRVWDGEDAPYQKSVKCGHCQESPRYFWRFPEQGSVSGGRLASLLDIGPEVEHIEIENTAETGRAGSILIRADGKKYRFSGNNFRKRAGYERIRSTLFQVDREDGGFVFRGSGAGHGVGMCQWGAKGMAETGRSAEEILEFYFPGTDIKKLY